MRSSLTPLLAIPYFLCLLSVSIVARAEFPKVKLVPISEGELVAPVGIRNAGDGSDRLFTVDQRGKIQIIEDGVVLAAPFLDIESKLVAQRANFDERGLLGLAFHPNYGNVGQPGYGKFYVYYSADSMVMGANHKSVIAEYTVSGDPDLADEMSERILLTIEQPQFNHNGGDLAFGPTDGFLYISTGDGGSSNDNNDGHTGGNSSQPNGVLGNAQDKTKLLGKILRIDPLGDDGPGGEYGIPSTNPFVGDGGGVREEIFAYGLRNPWRMCFDEGPGGSNELFVADVGQGSVEEVNVVGIGDNMGWRNREGSFVFDGTAPGTGPFVDPLVEYAHPGVAIGGLPQIGVSVTGGCFYRGSRFTTMQGRYFFGDWSVSGGAPNGTLLCMEENSSGGYSLLILDVEGGNPIGKYITAFGTDENGEIYVATREVLPPETHPTTSLPTGAIYRIEAQSVEMSIELEPTQDNTIFSENQNSNGVGDWIFAGFTAADDERRALFRFDVASQLPSGALITDAVLELDMDKTISGSVMYDLHRITSDWGEGTSDAAAEEGKGAAPTTGDATWENAFHDTVAWSAQGGDFLGEVSASVSVSGNGTYRWSSAQLATDVQDWIDGEASNFGWLLSTADTSTGNAKRFKSRENPTASGRPKLTITYSTEVLPTYQPDSTIKAKRKPTLGNNVYNLSSAGQSIRLKGFSNQRFKYDVGVQNDADDTDSIQLIGSRKNKLFKTKYLLQQAGRVSNITAGLSRGGVIISDIAPGGNATIRVVVKAKGAARKRNAVFKGFVLSRSRTDTSKQDRVFAKVLSKKKKKRR